MAKRVEAVNLAETIESEYGANALQCDAIAIEWAASKLVDAGTDAAIVAKQWKALNAKRYRRGVHAPLPRFEHPCFAAY